MKVSFKIDTPEIIITILVLVIFTAGGGFDPILNYLRLPNSILAIHGSWLAGVTAIIAAFLTLRGVREQISADDRRLERDRIYKAAAFAHAMHRHIIQVKVAFMGEPSTTRDGTMSESYHLTSHVIKGMPESYPAFLKDPIILSYFPAKIIAEFLHMDSTLRMVQINADYVLKRYNAGDAAINSSEWIDMKRHVENEYKDFAKSLEVMKAFHPYFRFKDDLGK